MSDFETRNKKAWRSAVMSKFGAKPPQSVTWTGVHEIIDVLKPFMDRNLNHALLPGGGGLDFHSIDQSREAGCIQCDTGEQSFYLGKPTKLTFEYMESSPENSFFLIDLERLPQSGVYETVRSESEQLLEVGEEYLDYAIWARGFLGYDHEGNETPIPEDARIVVRLLRGKILVVAKTSLWNSDTGTYDGRHDRMAAEQIRGIIERSL